MNEDAGQATRLRAILRTHYELGTLRDPAQVPAFLCEAAARLTGASAAAVLLDSPGRPGERKVVARRGDFPPFLDEVFLRELADSAASSSREAPGEGARAEVSGWSVLALPMVSPSENPGALLVARRGDPISDEDHALLAMLSQQGASVLASASALRAVERALAREKAILNRMTDGLVLIEGDRVAFVTARARELLAAAAPAAGDRFVDFLARLSDACEEKTSIRERMAEALVSAQRRPVVEVRLLHAPARDLRLRLFTIPAPDEETLLGFLVSDFTREMEAQRLRAEFFRNVSHELRTPLSSIRAYAEMLLSHPEGADRSTASEFLRTIVDETDRLAHLIGGILAFSRAEAGVLTLTPEPVALVPAIRSAVGVIAPQAKAASITIESPADGAALQATADRAALHQVLLNLLSNAVKYNHAGGQVSVSAEGRDGRAWIRIADSGMGLTDDDRRRLFERFYRSPSVSPHIAGTGIGLSLAKTLVEQMGGTIGAESRAGGGAVFSISLPLEAA